MSKARSHNSILLITTLGVYLGLLMAGSTPAVAHAATARIFEITDEIEVRDDLDKKPDDKRAPLSDSVGNYYADIENFVALLSRLNGRGIFDPAADSFDIAQETALPCIPANRIGSYSAERFSSVRASLHPALKWLTKQMTDGYGLAECLPSSYFDGKPATHTRFAAKLDQNSLSFEVSGRFASAEIAQNFLGELAKAWESSKLEFNQPLHKQISEGTALSFTGNKILVVTNLPRAGLDPHIVKSSQPVSKAKKQ